MILQNKMKKLYVMLTTVNNTKEKKTINNKGMALVDVIGKMDLFMKVNGKIIYAMAKEYLYLKK